MRLGALEIRRHVQAADTPRLKAQPALGASGTTNTDGYLIGHEYNRDLVFPRSIEVYNRMRRSDATVREALFHLFSPIENATWVVEPASDDELDLEVAAFVQAAYMDWLSQPFSVYLHQALLHLAHGFQLFETPTYVREDELEWDTPSGEQQSVSRQWVTWQRFASRLPETIQKWHVADGELVSVEQYAQREDGSFGPFTIPAERFLLFVNEQEGDDFTGLSILRTAYKAWYLKETVEKTAGVAVERHGVGVNTAYIPDRYRDDENMMARVEGMMRDLRAGEFSYLVFPGPKGSADQQGRDGFTFEIVSPQGSLPDLVKFLEYLRGEIKGNVLARFAELGQGQTGARATAESQANPYAEALETVARYICAVNDTAIRRLVDLNYNVSRYPKLACQDIESKNLTEFADAHSKLMNSGGIKADRTYRQFLRDVTGSPDEDEDAEEQLAPPELPPDDDDGPERERPQDQPPKDPPPEPARAALMLPPTPSVTVDLSGLGEALAETLVTVLAAALEPVRAIAERQPERPVVNVDTGISDLAEGLRALAARENPAPVVTVEQAAPVVNVDLSPLVDVLRELATRPQEPPVVNVNPKIEVEMPAPRTKRVEIEHDSQGRTSGAIVKEV